MGKDCTLQTQWNTSEQKLMKTKPGKTVRISDLEIKVNIANVVLNFPSIKYVRR